ncbi:hypothetical protein [Novosphingobium sp.]|uniref:hypothetical protein n=1 Tax=Novosphingobium sp. TaxID=1874826 RepID=UPI0035B425D0
MSGDFVGDAKAELSGMAKEGMRHPSTKPVIAGAAIGAAAGLLLPVLSISTGLAIGAGIAFYKRLRP